MMNDLRQASDEDAVRVKVDVSLYGVFSLHQTDLSWVTARARAGPGSESGPAPQSPHTHLIKNISRTHQGLAMHPLIQELQCT